MLRSSNFSEAKQTHDMFFFQKILSYYCYIELFQRKQETFPTPSEPNLLYLDSSTKHMIQLLPCLDSLKTTVEIICPVLESKHDKPDLL